jgi:glycosyltransferase involved in cell wall biosynthesis
MFNPAYQALFGGLETRIALIAGELARRGHFEVAMVVGDFGQPHVEQRQGITFFSWRGRHIWGVSKNKRKNTTPKQPSLLRRGLRRGTRYLEWFYYKFLARGELCDWMAGYPITPRMIRIYDEVAADVYLVPGNTIFAAEAALFCSQRGKPFVFQAGSDLDFELVNPENSRKKDIYGTPYAMKAYAIGQAAVHIVQSERQAQLLREGYRRPAVIIKNPIDPAPLFPRNPSARTILWVGKSDERVKRPALVLDLARRLPGYEFIVVMNEANHESHVKCLSMAKELPNITLLEYVPFEQIESYFADARLHVNTSVFEGFPNTFLQAAKYGVPTISMMVDPGGMLSQHGGGLVCGDDFGRLEENVRRLMTDNGLCEKLGRNAQVYVRKHHAKDTIIREYEQALSSALDGYETGRLGT